VKSQSDETKQNIPTFLVYRMSEQMTLPSSVTNPAMLAARFLLKPGRKYEDAANNTPTR
jgi:hypothetical protein